jgi:hypothetical protein
MYGKGSGVPPVVTAATLPVTGSHGAVGVALALAAGLAAWAGLYVAQAKFGKR